MSSPSWTSSSPRADAVAPDTVTDRYGIIHDQDDAEPHFKVLMRTGHRGLGPESYSRALAVPAQQIHHPGRGGRGSWDHRLSCLSHADDPSGTPHLQLQYAWIVDDEENGTYRRGPDMQIPTAKTLGELGFDTRTIDGRRVTAQTQ